MAAGIVTLGILAYLAFQSFGPGQSAQTTTTTTTEPSLRWQNPVIPSDFPDPFVVHEGAGFVAVATNGPGGRIQVATSADLAHWSAPTEGLTALPAWSSQRADLVWAPSIVKIGEGWLLYATFQDETSGRQCIGVAQATNATGPYNPVGARPLVCPTSEGGAIDPEVTLVGEVPWLLWKVDGNCCGRPTPIRSQQLAADGLSLVGSPSTLLNLDLAWERGPNAQQSTIEGPSMATINGQMVLLYSGSAYSADRYAMGYALCESIQGPCSKSGVAPTVATGGGVSGPGGGSFFFDTHGRPWISYHAWDPSRVGYPAGGVRTMRIDRVALVDDRLVVLGPTTDAMELSPTELLPRQAVSPGAGRS